MSLYDQNIANTAAAIQQCLTMGGVILAPKSVAKPGFSAGK